MNYQTIENSEFGRLVIHDMPIPAGINTEGMKFSCTYTYTGRVLMSYQLPEIVEKDPSAYDAPHYLNIAVMNDDGTDFRHIWSGLEGNRMPCNGVRYMPFRDNKRVHLGCNILECYPDIDHCEHAELVPIEYPKMFGEKNEGVWEVWTEVIVSPDNVHVAWTELHNAFGANNYVAALRREKDRYVLDDVQCISCLGFFRSEKDQPGYLRRVLLRGGEVKQFVRNGNAISLAGGSRAGCSDSFVQALDTEEYTRITSTPGYDETTMFSPDENLGIVMSSRFSEKTDPAIFGLMPRPLGTTSTIGLTTSIYKYAIMSARFINRNTGKVVREGNIGPALVNIEKSMTDPDYLGVCLASEDPDWVYMSPISWHPNGKKAMWREVLRTDPKWTKRMRILELPDYEPGETVTKDPVFPEHIPYAFTKEEIQNVERFNGKYHGKIRGEHSGWAQYDSENGMVTDTCVEYHDFSNDGKTFWNGMEHVHDVRNKDAVYEAHIKMTGEEQGEMDLRATWHPIDIGIKQNGVRLDFSMAEDGKPASYGFASYNGKTLRMEDLSE